jgi:hypothetical protein
MKVNTASEGILEGLGSGTFMRFADRTAATNDWMGASSA